jgi:hypothetical protein
MTPGELLDGGLLVGEAVIAQVAVPVVVVPLRPLRLPTSMTTKPNCANATLLLRGLKVLVTLSVCGPG